MFTSLRLIITQKLNVDTIRGMSSLRKDRILICLVSNLLQTKCDSKTVNYAGRLFTTNDSVRDAYVGRSVLVDDTRILYFTRGTVLSWQNEIMKWQNVCWRHHILNYNKLHVPGRPLGKKKTIRNRTCND